MISNHKSLYPLIFLFLNAFGIANATNEISELNRRYVPKVIIDCYNKTHNISFFKYNTQSPLYHRFAFNHQTYTELTGKLFQEADISDRLVINNNIGIHALFSLQKGDLIFSANHAKISTVSQLHESINIGSSKRRVFFTVQRNELTFYVSFELHDFKE